ncbi:MAG: LysR family transcriptional regulator [Byssovorax sp.]
MMDIARFDLNLLVAFDALFCERSVTRAARRIGLSQPAMSGALGRLRALVDDPLFVRSSGGMLPTPRAQALGVVVARALGELKTALSEEAVFEPQTSTRRFTLAVSEPAMAAVLPPLVAELRARAPGVSLKVVPLLDHQPPREIAAGEMDGAIGLLRHVPADHRRRLLFRESLVSVVRADRPGPRDRIALADYLGAPHLLISPQGKDRGSVDVALGALGHHRTIAVVAPTMSAAAGILRRSDVVLTIGARLARSLAAEPGLSIREVPVEIPPYEITLVWHERSQQDPAHVWLRELLGALGDEAEDECRRARAAKVSAAEKGRAPGGPRRKRPTGDRGSRPRPSPRGP